MHGLPTLSSISPASKTCSCWKDIDYDDRIGYYRQSWLRAFVAGDAIKDVVARTECDNCRLARKQRQRVLDPEEAIPEEIATPVFASAPAIYSFNVPRYFTTQVRARRFAAIRELPITWMYAKDVPLHRDDLELSEEALNHKMLSWLRRHDQDTSHLASVLPLVIGLPVRLTDRVDSRHELQLFRGRRGRIWGWTEPAGCLRERAGEDFILHDLPEVLYVQFDQATFKVVKQRFER